jgi:hypothetical protein
MKLKIKNKNRTLQSSENSQETFDKFEMYKSALADTGNEYDNVVAALLVCAETLSALHDMVSELRYYMRSA